MGFLKRMIRGTEGSDSPFLQMKIEEYARLKEEIEALRRENPEGSAQTKVSTR